MIETLDAAVGRQCRALREEAGLSQDQVARACQRAGLSWPRTRVGQLEAGDMVASVGLMVVLARAYADALDRPVALTDLLPDADADSDLEATAGVTVTLAELRRALRGVPATPPAPIIGTVQDPRLHPGWGIVEDRVLAEVGDLPEVVLRVATALYAGRTGTEERDHRAGPGATPQKRGRVTRLLVKELVDAVNADQAEGDY